MTQEFRARQIWEACQQKKVCKIKFRDEFFVRIVHPYGICQTRQNKIVIVCWQVDGPGKGGNIPSYRNMLLENCEGVEILDETFEVQQNFNPEDSIYKDWVFHI
jgi:hypothetical protein